MIPTGVRTKSKNIRLLYPFHPWTLDLRIAASVFPTSSLEVFRKVKGIDDDREMKDIPYVQMTQANAAISAEGRSQSPYSDSFKSDFFDYEYSENDINEFTSFKVKIVMKGTNPAYPPRITDMRGIALAV